ncbi:MAG: right-handed parallel beta-helix repeat-containing protein [Candidatus Eiseniibacteriota bacterium]|nr:MAG: right-handed parallel beta-helix repeat-containing protein [Candidatus Eisenbacteria bacterium]
MSISRVSGLLLLAVTGLATSCLLPNAWAETPVFVAKGVPDSLFSADPSLKKVTELQEIVSGAPDSSLIIIEGHHWLKPQVYNERTCGNCEDPATEVTATVGLLVTGKGKRLVGLSPEESVVHTNSGYGILFEDCEGCAVESLTVTDGVRDSDANATDAGIVIKGGSVHVVHNRIVDNIGDPETVRKTVVGVMGITAREKCDIELLSNEIIRNSWDGIALYRDVIARVDENFIDGVDLARGDEIGGGRGVGIGLTWNAKAALKDNVVRRYWKGIGIFVDANALVVQNIVEDVATWGISLWDAGKGAPFAMILGNVVFRTGACGIAVTRGGERPGDGGLVVKNLVAMSGQDPKYDSGEPYCSQRALALHSVPEKFQVNTNWFYANREPGGKEGSEDLSKEDFLKGIAILETQLRGAAIFGETEVLKWLDSLRKE